MVEHTTLLNKVVIINSSDYLEKWKSALNGIMSAYNWCNGSEVIIGSTPEVTYGKYYFTDDSYIKIYYQGSYCYLSLVTPSATKTIQTGNDAAFTISVGTTSNGICICAYSSTSGNTRDPRFYNLYVGDITTLDGTTTKGCIYVADDNSYTVATDSGISSEATFSSTIDSTRKAYLIPVTDSTHGYTFKNVFMMKNAPLNYNAMKIEDTQKIYLCGKAICMED